jgi:hypothetical protein
LGKQGHHVSIWTVSNLLHAQGFSLQGNSKHVEGKQHPDRDEQFTYLNTQAQQHMDRGDPVISVDAKKKNLLAISQTRDPNGCQ